MKILMLNAPFTRRFSRTGRWQASSRGNSLWYPAWLCYATGVLEKDGHDVMLIDAPADGKTLDDVAEATGKYQPGLIVIDTSTPSIRSDLFAAETLKKTCTASRICMVGPHASALPLSLFSESGKIDFVAKGEYDYTLRDLARCLENGGDISGVAGLYYRNGSNPRYTHDRPYIADLDELPFLSDVIKRHLNIKNYSLDFTLYPYIDIFTGRGCAFGCKYCLWNQTLMGRQYRRRSLGNVFKEIDYVIANMPYINEFIFDDDTFTVDRERVADFSKRIIANNYKFSWVANVRPDIDDINLLKLMRKAGCRAVVVGFESGSQRILDNTRKGTRLDKMETFARLCKETGIQIHGDFMAGLPGETKETVKETLEFVKRIQPDTFQFSIAVPFPGTEFYAWLRENGYLDTEDYSRWLDEEGRQRCVINYPELPKEEIVALVRRTYLRYYIRPAFIWSVLQKILVNPKEFVKFFIAGKRFLRYVLEKE